MFMTLSRTLLAAGLALVACTPVSVPAAAPTAAPSPTAMTAASTDTPIPTAATPTAEPTGQALYDGAPFGVTAEGFHYLGDPTAPVTLIDYSDFL